MPFDFYTNFCVRQIRSVRDIGMCVIEKTIVFVPVVYTYSQGQETFLTSFDNDQIRSYDTECSNHRPPLSTLTYER